MVLIVQPMQMLGPMHLKESTNLVIVKKVASSSC